MTIFYKDEEIQGVDFKDKIDNLFKAYEKEEHFNIASMLEATVIQGANVLVQKQYYHLLLGAIVGIASRKGVDVIDQVKTYF